LKGSVYKTETFVGRGEEGKLGNAGSKRGSKYSQNKPRRDKI